jgi:hypothetical protein
VFADVLKCNKTITSLSICCELRWCCHAGVGMRRVRAATYISEDGAASIADALKANSTLKSLKMGGVLRGDVAAIG